MTLNETEILVMQTIIMKLNEAESLAWVRSHLPPKKKMDRSTFYRIKGRIVASADKRKFELQKKGLWEQHLERIDQLETTLKFSWQNYHRETDITKKQRILDSISNLQPLLSAYYGASQEVIERDVQKDIQITGHISDISN